MQHMQDTFFCCEGSLMGQVRDCVEEWRQQRSTAGHGSATARLMVSLEKLRLYSAADADEIDSQLHRWGEANLRADEARAAACAPELLRSCELASCSAKEAHVKHFSRCAACTAVVSCSKTCQTADWPAHKKACKAARKAAEAAKAASAGA